MLATYTLFTEGLSERLFDPAEFETFQTACFYDIEHLWITSIVD